MHPLLLKIFQKTGSGAMSQAETPLELNDLLPSERQYAASQFRESSHELFAKLKQDGFIVLASPTAAKIRLSRAHQSLRSYRCKATFEGTFVSARHLPRRHVLEFNAGSSAAVLDQELPPAEDEWSQTFQKQALEATQTLKVATNSVLDAISFAIGFGINAARHHLLEDEVAGADGTVSSSILHVVSYEPAATPAEALEVARYGEHVDEGLLTAVYCPTPGLQVYVPHTPDRPYQGGQWTDVWFGHDSIMFMVGHTLEHATAGVLRACIHRVQPTTSVPWRTSLSFKLKARSTAIVPRGLMQGKDDSVSALMQRFRQTHGPSLNGAARVSAQDEERPLQRRKLAKKKDGYTFFFKTLTHREFEITMECMTLLCPVLELKRSVEQKEGIPVDQIRLVFSGKQLEDDATLLHCGLYHGCTIHLILKLRGD